MSVSGKVIALAGRDLCIEANSARAELAIAPAIAHLAGGPRAGSRQTQWMIVEEDPQWRPRGFVGTGAYRMQGGGFAVVQDNPPSFESYYPEAGIELMRNAIAATEGTTERNRRTLYLSHLASAHARLCQPEVALNLLNEAIQTAEATNERYFEAELYRLRGEILLTLGRRGEVEASLRRGLTIARHQQARWWELRAAASLEKHWRDEGKYLEAYSLLQPVYGWFVEGFDTASLKDAKALLDELRDLPSAQAQAGR